jgi:hypothetical protein
MDRARTKWRITRQDKTRYDNTGELRVLLIHQLVLVCWRAVPQTISFYNPEPSYLEMPRRGYTVALLQCCQICTAACCNTSRSTLLHAATLTALLVPTFVLSNPRGLKSRARDINSFWLSCWVHDNPHRVEENHPSWQTELGRRLET